MFAKLTLSAHREGIWLKSKHLARALKIAVGAFAILYLINGAGAAVGYANTLPVRPDGPEQHVADAIWVGVAWPVVLLNTMVADPMQRLGPLPQVDS